MLITLTGCLKESIENHPKQNVVVEEYKERNDVVSAAGNIVAYQVDHYAPINDKGHKPTYIYMWSKLSKYWDTNEIEKSIKILAMDFFNLDIERVELLEIPTYEETKLSFQRDYAPFI